MMHSLLSRSAWALRIAPHILATTVAVLVPMASLTAYAQATASVFLEKLTWTELRDLIAAGKTTILGPIGGTEQNGPQMVLGKHNFRANALAEKISLQPGNALVAPEIAYVPKGDVDPPTGHMRFPGTITVPHEVLAKLLEDAARSFRQGGFRDICFLEDSGGYERIWSRWPTG